MYIAISGKQVTKIKQTETMDAFECSKTLLEIPKFNQGDPISKLAKLILGSFFSDLLLQYNKCSPLLKPQESVEASAVCIRPYNVTTFKKRLD